MTDKAVHYQCRRNRGNLGEGKGFDYFSCFRKCKRKTITRVRSPVNTLKIDKIQIDLCEKNRLIINDLFGIRLSYEKCI